MHRHLPSLPLSLSSLSLALATGLPHHLTLTRCIRSSHTCRRVLAPAPVATRNLLVRHASCQTMTASTPASSFPSVRAPRRASLPRVPHPHPPRRSISMRTRYAERIKHRADNKFSFSWTPELLGELRALGVSRQEGWALCIVVHVRYVDGNGARYIYDCIQNRSKPDLCVGIFPCLLPLPASLACVSSLLLVMPSGQANPYVADVLLD